MSERKPRPRPIQTAEDLRGPSRDTGMFSLSNPAGTVRDTLSNQAPKYGLTGNTPTAEEFQAGTGKSQSVYEKAKAINKAAESRMKFSQLMNNALFVGVPISTLTYGFFQMLYMTGVFDRKTYAKAGDLRPERFPFENHPETMKRMRSHMELTQKYLDKGQLPQQASINAAKDLGFRNYVEHNTLTPQNKKILEQADRMAQKGLDFKVSKTNPKVTPQNVDLGAAQFNTAAQQVQQGKPIDLSKVPKPKPQPPGTLNSQQAMLERAQGELSGQTDVRPQADPQSGLERPQQAAPVERNSAPEPITGQGTAGRGQRFPTIADARARQTGQLQGPAVPQQGGTSFNDIGREDARILREQSSVNTQMVDRPDATTDVDLLRQVRDNQLQAQQSVQDQVYGTKGKPQKGGTPYSVADNFGSFTAPKVNKPLSPSKGSIRFRPPSRGVTIVDAVAGLAADYLAQPVSDYIHDNTIRPLAEKLKGEYVPTAAKAREYKAYEDEYAQQMREQDKANAEAYKQQQAELNAPIKPGEAPAAPILPPELSQQVDTPRRERPTQRTDRSTRSQPQTRRAPAAPPSKEQLIKQEYDQLRASNPEAAKEFGLKIHRELFPELYK